MELKRAGNGDAEAIIERDENQGMGANVLPQNLRIMVNKILINNKTDMGIHEIDKICIFHIKFFFNQNSRETS